MAEFFTQLTELLKQNGVLSTVAGGSIIVWLVGNIKSIWYTLVSIVESLISFVIVNTYEDKRTLGYDVQEKQRMFDELVNESKSLWERTRNLDLSDRGTEIRGKRCSMFTYGFSIKVILGKIVFCYRSIDVKQTVTATTTLRVFFARQKKFLDRLNEEILRRMNVMLAQQKQDREWVSVDTAGSGMYMYGRKYKRSLDTIFTNNNEHIELVNSVKSFIDNEGTYKRLSYPYSYSALLYGKPGCGKSSTILALASALNRDIIYVNLSKTTLNELINALNTPNKILVFEDIDALHSRVAENRNSENGEETPGRTIGEEMEEALKLGGVSLSEILNVTDGLLASDGSICIFTTNHIERLDPALLRAGRMNKTVEFTYLDAETANRMVKHHLGYEVDGMMDDVKPAELQEMILGILLGEKTRADLEEKFCRKAA